MAKRRLFVFGLTLSAALASAGCAATATRTPLVDETPRSTPGGMVLVSPDNFVRAESHTEFTRVVDENGFGRFVHHRDVAPVDRRPVVRPSRDTLSSVAVFDLASSSVAISLPDAGGRYLSAHVVNEDGYVPHVFYGAGEYTLDQKSSGTRYVMVTVRILVDPDDPADLTTARSLQDAITVRQDNRGTFEVPRWDQLSQKKVRDALLTLAETVPDTRGMFGTAGDTDPVRHLIGAASAWGSDPAQDTLVLSVAPARNDGRTVYQLTLKDVPVKDFWSVTVYNRDGYFTPNPQQAYSVADNTATKSEDGSVAVQFGGCTDGVGNCLPTTPGWTYLVRLYRPDLQVVSGEWTFPQAEPVS